MIVGDLAISWKSKPNHKEYDFCVEKAQFHDGTELSVDDIAFSLKRYYLNKSRHYLASTLRRLNPEVQKISNGNQTFCFRILLKEPSKEFLCILASPRLAIVKNKSSSKDHIGLGCFALDTRNQNPAIIRFVRTDNRCKLDVIEIIELPDNDQTFQLVAYNQIDIYFGLTDSQRIPNETPDLKVTYIETMMVKHLIFNLQRPFAKNKEFRQDQFQQ